MKKSVRRISSLLAIVLWVVLATPTVYAYPIEENVYPLNSTQVSREEITDVETTVYKSKYSNKQYAYSPAICVTKTGRIIVSYDINAETGGVKYSDNGGVTFTDAKFQNNDDKKFLFGNVFETETGVYLMARRYSTGDTNGQLIIFKSTDNGANWGRPVTLDEGVWHTAPSEVMYLNGHVYITWEAQDTPAAQAAGGAGRGILAPVVLKGSVTADLSVASNWTISDTSYSYYDAIGGNTWDKVDYMGLPLNRDRYTDEKTGTLGISFLGWLEGNIVRITDPNNELYDPEAICHIFLRSSSGSADYANIMKIVADDSGNMISEPVTTPSGKTLLYAQIPGGQSKFSINYDETSGLYWLVTNVSTDSMAIDTTMGAEAYVSRHEGPHDIRNVLGLYYSENAMDWEFAGIVSRTDSIDQARSYASMEIAGNDLLVVSRSGDEDAVSGHNTNKILLHRIKNFRNLVTDTTVTTVAKSALSNSNGTAYYDASILQDESVGDIHTFVTAAGTTIVTCAISDDEGTESKVLVKNEDGYYAQTLSAGYKLGEAFEVNGALYVFGVADKELVAFKSTNEGSTWTEPATIDNTRDWYEAPTSSLINDNQIMLALSELQAGTFKAIRGYSGGSMGIGIKENSASANLCGYGAVAFTEAFSVNVGESIEVTVSPKTLQSSTNNMFSVMFSDTMGSYFGNVADKENGFIFRLRSNNDYTKTGNIWYNKVTNGELADADTKFPNSADLSGNMIENSYTVKLTRTASTTHPWTMSVTTTIDSNEYSYQIPAADLAADAFDDGVFVSYGNNVTTDAQKAVAYKVTKPVVTVKEEVKETETGTWTKFLPANNSAWSGTISANEKEVTLTNRAAAYYSQAYPVQGGTKISFDVTFPSLTTSQALQYAFGLSSHKNSLYPSDTVATASLGVQFIGSSAAGVAAQVEYETDGSNRTTIKKETITAASEWTKLGEKTYSITYTKQPNTNTTNSWVVTVTDGTTTKTVNVPVTSVAHNLFDSTGVYIATGSLNSGAHTMKISNLRVEQPAKNWAAIRGYSSTAGSLGLNDAGDTVFTGYGAVGYKDSYKLMPGESVSVTISPKKLKSGVNNKFFVVFGDTKNSFFNGTADTGNGVSFELRSSSDYTLKANAVYGPVADGDLGTQAGMTNASTGSEVLGNMTTMSYTITLTRTWNSAKPWKMVLTTSANEAQWVKEIPASDLAATAFDNGLYITGGGIGLTPADPTITYHVSDVTYDAKAATATAADSHKASPVVMTAALTADLTSAASWTYMEGTSLANKIGSVYANNRMDYFGLPYENVDVRTIGWTDLKLLKLYNPDDIRYNTATGNLFGYMTFTKAGYNYAAFVKVNTSTNAIEFFTPDSQVDGVVEEEFVFAKLPGGNNGFDIMYDATNKLYWLVTTVNTDTVNATDKSATKIAIYHSKNAYDWTYGGKVADVSGDARVSAAFSGDDIVITAVDGGVVNYIVPQYERLADVYNWNALRGYSAEKGSLNVGNQGQLILDGTGAVNCGTNIVNKENTQIVFTVKATDLTTTGSAFAVGLLDREGSFFGGGADTGNGFVVTIWPWTKHDGARFRYSAVKTGVASPAIGVGTSIGDQISGEMEGNVLTVKFIKRTQIIDSVAYTWTVEITDKNGGNVRTINIPSTDVGMNLFDNGCYMIAGACNEKAVTYEIDNVKVKQYVTGDVNFDGEINIMDITAIDYKYRQTGGNANLYAAYEKELYDIDGSGTFTIADIEAVRTMVLKNEAVSESEAATGATTGNVRLERKYYQKDGKDMTDITINTDFVCGGMEGLFNYDSTQLTYKGVTCRIGGVAVRNQEKLTVDNGTKGLMLVAMGTAKTGTKGNIITLTFEGQIKEWNQFSMSAAVFTGADGKEQIDTTFYDLLLGDVTDDQKDFEINVKDLVRMKKLIANEKGSKNADLNRDNKEIPDDTDCALLRDYLCGAITEF